MFIDIIPLVHLPRSQTAFTYRVADDLASVRVGQLVEIPFRKRIVRGLVFRVAVATPPKTMRVHAVERMVTPEPILDALSLQFFEWVAKDTGSALGLLCRLTLPSPLRRKKNISKKERVCVAQSFSDDASSRRFVAQWMRAWKKEKTIWIETMDRHARFSFFHACIEDAMQKKESLLLLFPTHAALDDVVATLPTSLFDQCVVFHAQQARGVYAQAWERIQTSSAPLVLGTRSAVFAPARWRHIILDQEEAREYKQEDRNPRYSTHRIVEYLAKRDASRIAFVSVAPRVTTWARYALHAHHPFSSYAIPSARILDMRGGGSQTEGHMLHPSFRDAIIDAIDHGSQAYCFLPRGGYAKALWCSDCGTHMQCVQCHVPFRVAINFLSCLSCGEQREMITQCPHCHSARLRVSGIGIERVQEAFQSVFSKEQMRRIVFKTDVDHSLFIPQASAGVVGIISLEAILHLPDFRAAEYAWQWIRHVQAFAAHVRAPIFLQTWNPDHHAVQAFGAQDIRLFYTKELTERKQFSVSPYGRLAGLLLKVHNKKEGMEEAEHLRTTLMHATQSTGGQILVSPPTTQRAAHVRGQWYLWLFLRQPSQESKEAFEHLLSLVPDHWLIDREPERIF